MANNNSLLTGLKRGLARRCPGKGQLFRGYLTIRLPCEVCGNDNSVYPSDDPAALELASGKHPDARGRIVATATPTSPDSNVVAWRHATTLAVLGQTAW
jgi:uncharacterized protein (DUF983 family)